MYFFGNFFIPNIIRLFALKRIFHPKLITNRYMEKIKILWADDEIDLLMPHIMFLKEKGYDVTTANNGDSALDLMKTKAFDIVFLDENMPGKSGLETLAGIKRIYSDVPVIMITKSEEEHIMDEAIGSQIADFLIKPVNPNQILLAIKKNLENKRLISEKTNMDYQQEFRQIGMSLGDRMDYKQWAEVYKKLIYWELQLEKSQDESMYEILTMQKNEANNLFCKYVEKNYTNWVRKPDDGAPVMSNTLMRKRVFPLLENTEEPLFFLLIDNLRYDQWKVIQPLITEYFKLVEEDSYYGILPTATQYARNSLFAGLMPSEIETRFPKMWSNDEDEGGKNLYEEQFLADQIQRLRKNFKMSYTKITNHVAGKDLVDNIGNMMQNQLNVIVYNFVDMLSHARTEMEVLRELADDEAAYRSITLSWFEHSPLFEALKKIADKKIKLVITTDHGTIKVKEPIQIVGDRNTNTNLRYKQGKNLNYKKNEVFEIKKPEDAMLPKLHLSSAYVFAMGDKFFAYPNNYNYYVNYYTNTFQHGGVSMEEMIIPFVYLRSK
jgi:DNA-binding NarL/FixJ family response regulator